LPGHVAADIGEIGFAGPRLVGQFAVKHNDRPIGEFEQLVEVSTDQEPSRATANAYVIVGLSGCGAREHG
jgi:hypothetical protein